MRVVKRRKAVAPPAPEVAPALAPPPPAGGQNASSRNLVVSKPAGESPATSVVRSWVLMTGL